MTTTLERAECSAVRLGRALPPGKTRYPLYKRLGGPHGRSGQSENLVSPGFDPRNVQPVVSRYTGWATRPALLNVPKLIWFKIDLMMTLCDETRRHTCNLTINWLCFDWPYSWIFLVNSFIYMVTIFYTELGPLTGRNTRNKNIYNN